MDTRQSDEIKALLDELDGKTNSKTSEARFQGIKTLCAIATRTTMQKIFGNSGDENVFEISGPCVLPKEMGGSVNFLGMETLKFCSFAPSQKGEIYCIFEVFESKERIAVKYENVEQVFGNQGQAFHNAVEVFTSLSTKRDEVINSIDDYAMDAKHKEDPNYGIW